MSVNYHAYQSRGVPFADYEAVSEQWHQAFAGYDPKRIADILKLEYDEEYLYLTYFGRPYRLRRSDGHLEKRLEAGAAPGRKQEPRLEAGFASGRKQEPRLEAGFASGRYRELRQEAGAVSGRYQELHREDGPGGAEWTEDLYFNESMAIYHLLHYTKDAPVITGIWVPSHSVDGVVSRNPRVKDPLLTSFCKEWTGRAEELREACRRLGGEEFSKGDGAFTFEAFPCLRLQLIFWDADEDFPAQLQVMVDQRVTDFVHYETVGCIISDLLEMLGRSVYVQ